MKALVVYDSVHGNTEKVARAIGEAIEGDVEVLHADKVDPSGLKELDLLAVGGPTHAGRPTKPISAFLDKVPSGDLNGVNVAAFDTRFAKTWVKIFGFTAPKIAGKLKKKGGKLVEEPEAFIVEGTEGPLRDGELEHAGIWAKSIAGTT